MLLKGNILFLVNVIFSYYLSVKCPASDIAIRIHTQNWLINYLPTGEIITHDTLVSSNIACKKLTNFSFCTCLGTTRAAQRLKEWHVFYVSVIQEIFYSGFWLNINFPFSCSSVYLFYIFVQERFYYRKYRKCMSHLDRNVACMNTRLNTLDMYAYHPSCFSTNLCIDNFYSQMSSRMSSSKFHAACHYLF